jgi:hypothetical protein
VLGLDRSRTFYSDSLPAFTSQCKQRLAESYPKATPSVELSCVGNHLSPVKWLEVSAFTRIRGIDYGRLDLVGCR